MKKDENFIIFDIKTNKDIKEMQNKLNKLGVSEEKKYIALEFAENMIEAKLSGSIKINDVYIVNVVKCDCKENLLNMRSVIDKVKDMRKNNIVGSKEKGLLSIAYADWDLDVTEEPKHFSIIARKVATSIV